MAITIETIGLKVLKRMTNIHDCLSKNRNFFEKMPDTLTLSMSLKFIGPVPQGLIDDLILVPLNFKEEE